MKGSKFTIVLNVVLLVAVAVLFAMQFMGKGGDANANSENQDTLQSVQPEAIATIDTQGKIVYVNSDTLLKHYELSKAVEAKFKVKQSNVESRLAAKERDFNEQYKQYMTLGQANMLTEEQKVTMPAELEAKNKEYAKLQQMYSEQLAKDYERYSMMVNDSVLTFLERYRVRNGYTFIFQYSNQGSALLAVDPSLNVTEGVLQELNTNYAANKPEL